MHTNGPNGKNVDIADTVHRANNINDIRTNTCASELVDIRNDQSELCLVQLVRESLCEPKPSPSFLMLWDDRGLQLFEKIGQLPDYFPSGLEKRRNEPQEIQPGSMIVDSGCR